MCYPVYPKETTYQSICVHLVGGAHGSERSVTVVAEEFLEASKQNQCRFDAPKIIFAFFDGITESVAGK